MSLEVVMQVRLIQERHQALMVLGASAANLLSKRKRKSISQGIINQLQAPPIITGFLQPPPIPRPPPHMDSHRSLGSRKNIKFEPKPTLRKQLVTSTAKLSPLKSLTIALVSVTFSSTLTSFRLQKFIVPRQREHRLQLFSQI